MRKISIAVSLLALGACTVGPDYAGPPSIGSVGESTHYARAGAQTEVDAPQLAQWWTNLGDPALDRLEQQALEGSPDLAIARARIAEARAQLTGIDAESYPSVSANGTAAHIRVPGLDLSDESEGTDAAGVTATNFYNLGLNASWEVDLFGGHRRQVEATRAEVGAAEASLADAQVALTSAVARTYVNLRGMRERIGLAQQAVAHRQAGVELQRQLLAQGVVAQDSVDQAEQALAGSRRQLLLLRSNAEQLLNALAVLVGEAPGAVDWAAEGFGPPPLPPASVSIGTPADLLVRRPDIRAAERRYAATGARIGVAEAAGLPRFSFLGLLGIGGTSIGDLTQLGDFTAIAAPMLQWNVLDFGRNRANVAQAEARSAAAAAEYHQTVLQALREVEDALSAFRFRREEVAELARAEASAASRARQARDRYERGVDSRIQLLTAELERTQTSLELAQAREQLTKDFIAVESALGLGWE